MKTLIGMWIPSWGASKIPVACEAFIRTINSDDKFEHYGHARGFEVSEAQSGSIDKPPDAKASAQLPKSAKGHCPGQNS